MEIAALDLYHVPAIDPSAFIWHLFSLHLIIPADSQRNHLRFPLPLCRFELL